MRYLEKPLVIGSISAVVAFLLDQVTKALMIANAYVIGGGYPVFPGFNLVLWQNDGASFGLLGGVPPWSLVALALVVCAWILILMLRTQDRIEALAYGSIIGGAFGNILDRVRFGAVTDFLDFYVGAIHWPAFNFADAFLISGVALIVLWSAIRNRRKAVK